MPRTHTHTHTHTHTRNRPRTPFIRAFTTILTRAWLLSAVAIQAGCAFAPQRQNDNQEALAGCRADADRVYDAQNRYQLSERDSRDSPNSGSGMTGDPAAGLSDKYSHDQMVDSCLSHSAAVPVATGH